METKRTYTAAVNRDMLLRGKLLLSCFRAPTHGYNLYKQLELKTNPGSLYRTMSAMEKDGLLRSDRVPSPLGPGRRIYTITDQGKEELARLVEACRIHKTQLDFFLRQYQAYKKEQ